MPVVPKLLLSQAAVFAAGSTSGSDDTIPISPASPVGPSCLDRITIPSASSLDTSCSVWETSLVLTPDDSLLISEAPTTSAAAIKAPIELAGDVHLFLPFDVLRVERKDVQEMDPAQVTQQFKTGISKKYWAAQDTLHSLVGSWDKWVEYDAEFPLLLHNDICTFDVDDLKTAQKKKKMQKPKKKHVAKGSRKVSWIWRSTDKMNSEGIDSDPTGTANSCDPLKGPIFSFLDAVPDIDAKGIEDDEDDDDNGVLELEESEAVIAYMELKL
ncbi:uncharacterized protein PHACADRAFT_192454 [Phanerochaete carnosa HHB-10118-sp]|uniref:Uncharacterized protein n=1 Tax=Phanerochaete carnosa (strain HHB-10118-sp) TaxID=650164 RepID=K5WKV9_PHACS|nr:uncharacterized protein PHACADRAFT_192454 [Phanerochaete carnosa HHB-10118-sp]EKM60055.1 hypothetical protein PHACADRAFT_192454 [Phanerochaete carnosa HHB-10118-sp]